MTLMNTEEKANWKLPEGYREMPPKAQTETVRACVVNFLNQFGRARIREIENGLGMQGRATLLRDLSYLVSTQQIYSDNAQRDPTYYMNGRLAHPLLQSNVAVGRREYVIRTYKGEIGKWITITEYERTSSEELKPRSGIRVDAEYIGLIIDELSRIKKSIEEDRSRLEDPVLKGRRKNAIH